MTARLSGIPDEVRVIADVPTLQVVADPLRLRLLELLRREPQTAKELAAALGVAQTKLYYHLRLLEERELVRVVETRVVSGIIEKRYGVTAYRLSVDRALLSPSAPAPDEGLGAFLSLVLDEARGEIERSIRAGLIDLGEPSPLDNSAVLGRVWYRLTPTEARRYLARLREVGEEFADLHPAGDDDPDIRHYEMLLGFYAVAPPARDASEGTPPPP